MSGNTPATSDKQTKQDSDKPLSAAEVAKRVRRPDDKPVTAKEVLSFRLADGVAIVVTTDGQKLVEGAKIAKPAEDDRTGE